MVESRHIWILEDDPGVQFVYEEVLGIRYRLSAFSCMADFRKALAEPSADLPCLLIADIRLPDESFLSFLHSEASKKIRSVPYMMVSSIDDLDALRLCFERGAIDYLTKPFAKSELIVKLERFFARPKEVVPEPVDEPAPSEPTGFTLDSVAHTISGANHRPLGLTTKEFQIIMMLKVSQNIGTTRREILKQVWGNLKVNEKTLDVHLHNLRRKIAPLGMKIKYSPPNRYLLLSNWVND